MDTLSDEALAAAVQNGDTDMFGPLIIRYEKKLFRYGRRFLSNPDNITDLVQDIFIKTYENLRDFEPERSFSPWIYRIAHNVFVNALKKQQGSRLVFVDFDTFTRHPVYEDPLETEKERQELQNEIEVCLEKIDQKYKEVIILHYFEELGYKEISEVLHIPIGTVGIRLRRGKESLKECYEKEVLSIGKKEEKNTETNGK
jgi:RNA polymerase sigma-70 factor (ECF subfamily)